MERRNGFWVSAGILAATACSHGGGAANHGATPSPAAQVAPTAAQVERMISEADGNQPGRVKSLANGYLVLEPYQSSARDTRLRVLPEAAVFEGDSARTLDALEPGADVRVFYRNPKGAEPAEVVGIELLDADEAREIDEALHDGRPELP
jgi:hypothetical protein